MATRQGTYHEDFGTGTFSEHSNMSAYGTVAHIASAKAAGDTSSFSDVITILKANFDNETVVSECIDALAFIALRSAAVRDSAGRLSVPAIVKSLEVHQAHARIVIAASRALTVLSTHANVKYAFDSFGAASLLLSALSTHIADAGVVGSACAALLQLAENTRTIQAMHKEEPCQLILSALVIHAALPCVVKAVVGLLTSLMRGSNKGALVTAGVCGSLVNALHAHSQHEGVVQSVC